MNLQTDVEGKGKALDGAVVSEKAKAEIDRQIKGFITIADNRELRDYFAKLPEKYRRYALSQNYGWQIKVALRFRG